MKPIAHSGLPACRIRILVLDAGAEAGRLTKYLQTQAEYETEVVKNGSEIVARARCEPLPDLVILGLDDAGVDSLELIPALRQARPLVKIVVLSLSDDLYRVVRAVHLGADTCVWNSLDADAFGAAIRECLPAYSDVATYRERPGDVEDLDEGGFFVMASPAMRRLRAQLDQVARIDIPVLCLGESGTGKEVVARLIHRLSARSGRPFLKVNCAALPSELLESELFGYERGAFTGAVRSKPGKFELCNHGTLFLDEIAEMPPELQAKLLHALQDQEFTRLGGCARVKVDVRVVAATNVNVREAIAAKRFREDLYYRLSAFVFSIPPLRQRHEDIPVLLDRYLPAYAERLNLPDRALTTDLRRMCVRYGWPGNVRELENFAKRYLILGEAAANFASERVSEGGVATNFAEPGNAAPTDLKSHVRGLREGAEISAIARALEQTNWNRKEAARTLNISYKCLLAKIRQHGLDQPSRKPMLQDYDVSSTLLRYTSLLRASSGK